MIDLTEKGHKFQRTSPCQAAFTKLKKLLTDSPIMSHPQDSGNFILDTDACDVSIGAVLLQIQDETEKVIGHWKQELGQVSMEVLYNRSGTTSSALFYRTLLELLIRMEISFKLTTKCSDGYSR